MLTHFSWNYLRDQIHINLAVLCLQFVSITQVTKRLNTGF